MNKLHNLETIFSCADLEKFRRYPPRNEDFVKAFSEDEYFQALSFVKRIPKKERDRHRLYIYASGSENRLTVTKAKKPKEER